MVMSTRGAIERVNITKAHINKGKIYLREASFQLFDFQDDGRVAASIVYAALFRIANHAPDFFGLGGHVYVPYAKG